MTSPAKLVFRRQYEDKIVSGLECLEDVLTQQQFVEEADINTLVRRFGLDKQPMPTAPFDPSHYGDFSDVPDLRTALDLVNDAKNRFMELPPKLRSRFHNSPAELWSFVQDEENADEAVRLGLLQRVQPETLPAVEPDLPAHTDS
ncbi:MAG: internal scaffolding protein [Microvirus sp.]|nr:MAG: internal scaffolding protein [Microvirus sp.]